MKYFHYDNNFGFTVGNNLDLFLRSYNTHGPKPFGSAGYGIDNMKFFVNGDVLFGFSMQGQNKFLTLSLNYGGAAAKSHARCLSKRK